MLMLIYIYDKFPKKLLNSEIIVQSLDQNTALYNELIYDVFNNLNNIPSFISKNSLLDDTMTGFNTGIIGGNNIEFLIKYSKIAIDFINTNIENLSKCKINNINLFYEQLLLKYISKHEGINISYLLDNVSNEYFELTNFLLHPKENPFIHMIGFSKKNIILCEQLIIRFKYEFPQYFNRTIKILESNSIFNPNYDL